MSKRFKKIADFLWVLCICFVLTAAMTACGDGGHAAEEQVDASVEKTEAPAVDPVEESGDFTTVNFTGPEQAEKGESELVYTISAANTEGLATATFRMEMDAAYVEEPVVEGLNDFMVLTVDFEEVDGKWVGEVIMMNLAGLTSEDEVDVASVYAGNKGVSGAASATLTDAVLSAYVGEDGEDWVDVKFGTTTVTTDIG